VEVSGLQPGRKFRLSARFPAGFLAPDGRPTQLTFKTDDPNVPVVAIPVTQATARASKTPGRAQPQAKP
jgi:hypothetical protein